MKNKSIFFCTECGNESPKWSGRCSACGAWNTLEEAPQIKIKSTAYSWEPKTTTTITWIGIRYLNF